jgi:hypothetical protein
MKDRSKTVDQKGGHVLSPRVHHRIDIGRVLDQERGVTEASSLTASVAARDWRVVHGSLLPAEICQSLFRFEALRHYPAGHALSSSRHKSQHGANSRRRDIPLPRPACDNDPIRIAQSKEKAPEAR